MRLLIVEDSEKLAKWLGKALQQRGYAVDQTHDGAQADSLLRTERYDAVILDLSELEARLQAVLRRAHGLSAPKASVGALEYDSVGRSFTLAGQRLLLRPKEHAVLEVLTMRMGKVISKAALHESVFSMDATTGQDVVEIYIHRLRKHLHDSGVTIVTLRGLGYVLEAS